MMTKDKENKKYFFAYMVKIHGLSDTTHLSAPRGLLLLLPAERQVYESDCLLNEQINIQVFIGCIEFH